MNLILLGAPGSGKGTQAKRLSDALGLVHVSSGDLFRANIEQQTELGRLAKRYMDRGDLVPDEVTIGMVRQRLTEPDAAAGVILDGFPRTVPQAEALDELLNDLGRKTDLALYLAVSEEEIVRRLSGRMICRECGRSFHKTFEPFTTCPIDRCEGEHLYQRKDDRPQTVRARLAAFREQTTPVIDYYRAKGNLREVSGEGSVAEVTAALLETIRGVQPDRPTG